MTTARSLAAACGLNSPALLGSFDRDSFLLRTSQGCLFQAEYPEWSESWPDLGMWDAGAVYELRSSEPTISASGSSLWPTAQTTDAASAARHTTQTGIMHPGTTLTDAIRMWAMPQAHDQHAGNPERVNRFGTEHGGRNLADDVTPWKTPHGMSNRDAKGKVGGCGGGEFGKQANHWPTPDVPNGGRTLSPEVIWPTPSARDWKSETGLENRTEQHAPNLSQYVYLTSLPDPAIPDGPGSCGSGPTSHRRLNPRFVEWLMGLPIGWSEL